MKLNLKIGAAVIAAAGLMAGVASASTIGANTGTNNSGGSFDFSTAIPVNFSLEGETLYGSTGVTTLPPVQVTLGSDYTPGDLITLTVAGATVGGNTATQLNSNPAASSAAAALGIHCWQGAAEDALIVSFLALNGNVITLRVTVKNSTNVVGAICRIWGIDVTSPSIAKLTNVTLNWIAATATGSVIFDASAPALPVNSPVGPTTVADTISQFVSNWGETVGAVTTSQLSGVVDVTSGRIFFAGPTIPPIAGNSDTTSWQAIDKATGPALAAGGLAASGDFFALGSPVATLTGKTATMTGIFTNLIGASTCSFPTTPPGALVLTGVAVGNTTLSSDCSTITTTISAPAKGATENASYTFDGETGKVLVAPQTFSGTFKFSYSGSVFGGGVATGSRTDGAAQGINPGSWSLNGFNAFVSYMPFGTGISQILYITNKSSQTGAVTIVGYNDQGKALVSFAAGTVAPGTVLQLSTALDTGVAAQFGAAFTGKVSFNVIANIPAPLAELYSAYNVSGNRVSVLNTSNGRVTTTIGGKAQSTTGTGL